MRWILAAVAATSWPATVRAVAPTDSYRDADAAMSGYLPNHNMDPNVVGSADFQNLWSYTSPVVNDNVLAKPLVYTPLSTGVEVVVTASETNWLRVLDAKTGALVASRQLNLPFLAVDSACNDISNYIGVTGTPIIDPATDIMYAFAKGYKDPNAQTGGTLGGEFRMYAVRIPSLEDVDGFPVTIRGCADNDPRKCFVAGIAHQRPSLTMVGDFIIAGFGSHCGTFNYTGYLISVGKEKGVGVVSIRSMTGPPGAPEPPPVDIYDQSGGRSGIWQSGMGLATEGSRVIVTTG